MWRGVGECPTISRMKTWDVEIAAWLRWLAAGGVAVATIELRTYQLARLARAFAGWEPGGVGTDDLAGWLGSQGWGLETLRSHRAACRSFYSWAAGSGRVERDPAALLRAAPAAPARPRPVADTTVEAALAGASGRVRLAIELGAHHGLRRGEIARAATTDLVEDLAGWSLVVHGKGGRDRVVPLLDRTAWLIRRLPAGPLVRSELTGGHMTPAHVGRLISRMLPGGVVPHQLRHRFATTAYQRTHDLRAVQELLGHASVATTQRYVAVASDSLRRAVNAAA